MAQTGYTPIQLYYSTTATNIPSAANLVSGELALNIADMKLYAKNSSGAVTLLADAGGTAVPNSLTMNNSGAGAASGTTFNGSAPVTLSYNTIGAPKADGTGASGTWNINITGNATTATTATNLAGGALDRIPVQSAAGTTTFITAPTTPGRYLYWDNISGFQWLAGVGTGTVTSVGVSGGTTGLTFSGSPVMTAGTITMSGTLGVNSGGTNSTAVPTAGALAYGDGTSYAFTSAGSTDQILKSNGASAPSWITTVSVGQGGTGAATLTANNVILGNGTSPVQFVAPGTNGNVLTSNGTTWTSQQLISGSQGFVTQATGGNQPPGAYSPSDSFALI